MHVVLGHVGQVEVDDVADAVDVDAAGDDVGGDEHAVTALLEAVERLLALRLRAVAVDRRTRDAALVQNAGNAVRAVLGPGEDQDPLQAVVLDQAHQQVHLLLTADRVDGLLDGLDRLRGGSHINGHRLVQGVTRDPHDLRRHGRREQQVLTPLGEQVHDALHVGPEAHVEHAVGLVEHQDLDVREIAVALVAEVEQTAGRGDEDVDATA